MYLTNKPFKAKQINSIEIWTDAFINSANVMIDRHHLLAGYSLSLICLALKGLFVRYISNLPSASDKKLCFTLWQLK
jgi:hypothetical protein